MMTSVELLDAYKDHFGLKYDSDVADRWGISRQSIRHVRATGCLSEERAAQMADEMGLNVGAVLVDMRAERATDPVVKSAWKTLAMDIKKSAIGLAAFAMIGIKLTIPPLLIELGRIVSSTVILCNRRRRRTLQALKSLWFSSFGSFTGAWPTAMIRAMKGITIIALPILFAACGNFETAPAAHDNQQTVTNHGFGFQFDESSTVTGIRVRTSSAANVLQTALHADELDRIYLWTAEHMQIGAVPPGPLVIYAARAAIPDNSEGADGTYYTDTNTIVADTSDDNDVNRLLCHEYVHRLLFAMTGNTDAAHISPYFNDCYSVFHLAPGEHRTIP